MTNVSRRLNEETEREISPYEASQPEYVDYRTTEWWHNVRDAMWVNIQPVQYSNRTGRWA